MIKSLLNAASRHQEAIIPGYTHLQRAQPIHFAHWCLAYVEMLKRDLSRLDDLKVRMNQCPLGSGALAGTTFPVDRHAIAEELGFDSPCLNSLDAVSDRDFVLELLFVASTSMMHLSRLAEDMIFYNSGEAGFLQLGDSVTSGSSLMPQKKNPDALELNARQMWPCVWLIAGTIGYHERPSSCVQQRHARRQRRRYRYGNQWHICLCIASEVLDSLQLNEERCRVAATQGFSNATELADYLVGKGVPFRTGHDIAGRVVLQAIDKGCAIEDLPLSDMQAICDKIEDDVYPVLQLEYGVNQRNILGGTSKETVTKALYQELEDLDKQG